MAKQHRPKSGALLLVVCCGIAAICLAYSMLADFGRPSLFIAMAPGNDGSVQLQCGNRSKNDLYLDAEGMQPFLFLPASGGEKYTLVIRSKPFGASEAENSRRLLGLLRLAPGETAELGDLSPLFKKLPPKLVAIDAVYSSLFRNNLQKNTWSGYVRSSQILFRRWGE